MTDAQDEPEAIVGQVTGAPLRANDPLTLGEVFDAVTPQGTDKKALLDALKAAQRTGGQIPGRTAPDISGPASAVPDVFKRAFPALGSAPERQPMCVDEQACCVCGDPKVVYHNYRDQPFCAPCADGEPSRFAPPPEPEDPFTPGDSATIAIADTYFGLIDRGVPVASVERIIGIWLGALPGSEPQQD